MANAFNVEPLMGTTFGATVTDLKLSTLDDETFASLYRIWLEYALLIFPGQHLSKADQSAFARRFGPLEFDPGTELLIHPSLCEIPMRALALIRIFRGLHDALRGAGGKDAQRPARH